MMFIVQSVFDDVLPFDGTVDEPFVVPQDERAFPTAPVAMLMIEFEVIQATTSSVFGSTLACLMGWAL